MLTFSHDTISGTFSKWEDTISGTTCGWLNLEAQSGLVLVHVNTRDNTDRLRTDYGQIAGRISTVNKANIDAE